MAEIVNLTRARKKKRAGEKEKTADANRRKFGRTKVEKENERREQTRAEKLLDGCKRETDD